MTHYAELSIDDAKLKETMDELQAAIETIRVCYGKLYDMKVLRIRTEEAASGN